MWYIEVYEEKGWRRLEPRFPSSTAAQRWMQSRGISGRVVKDSAHVKAKQRREQ